MLFDIYARLVDVQSGAKRPHCYICKRDIQDGDEVALRGASGHQPYGLMEFANEIIMHKSCAEAE